MFKLRSISLLVAPIVVTLAINAGVPMLSAQTLASSASLTGTVADSTGARVPKATVTISSPEKGITRVFKTDGQGNFSFALLPASVYTLKVETAGFKTFKQDGITLEVGQSAVRTSR